jgi:hypothetical protein
MGSMEYRLTGANAPGLLYCPGEQSGLTFTFKKTDARPLVLEIESVYTRRRHRTKQCPDPYGFPDVLIFDGAPITDQSGASAPGCRGWFSPQSEDAGMVGAEPACPNC